MVLSARQVLSFLPVALAFADGIRAIPAVLRGPAVWTHALVAGIAAAIRHEHVVLVKRKLRVMDALSTERRSENMRRIRSRDTSPELQVRRFIHSRGLRYRLYVRELPGKPDLVFPAIRACVFVHGCFWHGCTKCIDGTRKVRSRRSYWIPKISGNRTRDAAHAEALSRLGWKVFTVWECEVRDRALLQRLATRLLVRRMKAHEKRQAARGVQG